MKNAVLVATAIAALLGTQVAWADSDNVGPIDVSASVAAVATLDCTINKCAGTDANCVAPTATGVATMNFDNLVDIDPDPANNALASTSYFKVFCGINTSSRPFSVTQTGTALTRSGGIETIPDNAWVFAPIAAVDDTDADAIADDPLPAGVVVGPKISAHSTGASWINTGTNTSVVVIQATYGVSAPPNTVNGAAPVIPPNQTAGTYAAQVTWDLTTL